MAVEEVANGSMNNNNELAKEGEATPLDNNNNWGKDGDWNLNGLLDKLEGDNQSGSEGQQPASGDESATTAEGAKGKSNAPSAGAYRVFVTKIPENLTSDDLGQYFQQFGVVEDLFVPLRNPHVKGDRSHKNIAFVSFRDQTVYEEILSRREYEIKQGIFVVVDRAMGKGDQPSWSSKGKSLGKEGKKGKGKGKKEGKEAMMMSKGGWDDPWSAWMMSKGGKDWWGGKPDMSSWWGGDSSGWDMSASKGSSPYDWWSAGWW